MVCLSGFNATYTRPYVYGYTATARMSSRVHYIVMYYMPILYCVYALVGGEISIRDPYICAVHQSVNESHAVFHRPVVCAVKT